MPRRVNGALLILLAISEPVSAQVSKRSPNAQVSPSVRQFHTQMLTLDTHLDTPAVFGVTGWSIRDRHDFSRDGSQVDLPRLKEGGLDGGFWAIYTPQGPRTPRGDREARDFALRRALQIREMVAANSDSFDLALEADDAPRIAARNKRVVFLSMENGYPREADLSLLETFYGCSLAARDSRGWHRPRGDRRRLRRWRRRDGLRGRSRLPENYRSIAGRGPLAR